VKKVKNMKLEQSKLVQWKNIDGEEIVWLVTDKENVGVVVHSDGLSSVGTTNDLSTISNLQPFVGTVNIVSSANN
jgi:hypothetical protein